MVMAVGVRRWDSSRRGGGSGGDNFSCCVVGCIHYGVSRCSLATITAIFGAQTALVADSQRRASSAVRPAPRSFSNNDDEACGRSDRTEATAGAL